MKTIILDAGHGIDTPGKRSVIQPTLFEFEFNRDIVRRIEKKCLASGFETYNINPEIEDVPLMERVRRANRYAKRHSKKKCFGISIHANAGGGKGIEVYSDTNTTFSDQMAENLVNQFKENLPGEVSRGHKERDFTILHSTSMPFVLGETYFMDTIEGYNKLRSEFHREKIAHSYFKLICWIHER